MNDRSRIKNSLALSYIRLRRKDEECHLLLVTVIYGVAIHDYRNHVGEIYVYEGFSTAVDRSQRSQGTTNDELPNFRPSIAETVAVKPNSAGFFFFFFVRHMAKYISYMFL